MITMHPLLWSHRLRLSYTVTVALATFAITSPADELRLNNGIVDINQQGEIKHVIYNDKLMIGKCRLVGELTDNSKNIAQDWSAKPSLLRNNNTIKINGQMPGGPTNTVSDDEATFSLFYEALKDGEFHFEANVEYLKTSDWNRPFYYYLQFPVADYIGGTIAIEGASGKEKTYILSPDTLKINGESKIVTFVKEGESVVITASEGSHLLVIDCRAWGEDTIRVDVTADRTWAAVQSLTKGDRDTFGTSVSFQESH